MYEILTENTGTHTPSIFAIAIPIDSKTLLD